MSELSQEELEDELAVSQNRYMTCSICEQEVSGEPERMQEHFEEKHGYKPGG